MGDLIQRCIGTRNGKPEVLAETAVPRVLGAMRGHDARADLLQDASALFREAAERGEWLSQRGLATQLREHGYRFPNDQLRQIAEVTRPIPASAA
ncbi:MAG: hypothetical protein ACRDRJ_17085 [Streptosporangiaceae bacterium]